MRKATRPLPCEYCDGIIRTRLVRDDYWTERGLIIIEKVPVGVCDRCGERYYDQAVLEKMERIAARRTKIKRKITVPVAQFGVVA